MNVPDFLLKYFDEILNSYSDGITIADKTGKMIYCNDKYVELSGISRDKLIGRNIKELVHEKLISQSSTVRVMETNEKASVIQQFSTGREHLVTGVPIFNEQNQIELVVNTNRDITEFSNLRKNLEKQTFLTKKYQEEVEILKKSFEDDFGIIAHSKTFGNVVNMAKSIAQFDSTVLITGESGVGKEVIAGLIHKASRRNHEPYIRVNCGAIPKNLVESELFGYEPGAFTGANRQGKPGVFELAHSGTLFLDEIGELPLDIQVKLLRTLQDLEVTRVGGTKSIHVNLRLITATNRDLKEMVKCGLFRKDLYYRLNIIPLQIPPLRERKEDIIPLVQQFLKKYESKYKIKKWFSSRVLRQLEAYDWPGNVRELQNLVERVYLLSKHEVIDIEDLPLNLYEKDSFEKTAFLEEGIEKLEIENHDYPQTGLERIIYHDLKNKGLQESVDWFEKVYLRVKLREYGTLRDAAKDLKIDPSTLGRKIKRYNLKRVIELAN